MSTRIAPPRTPWWDAVTHADRRPVLIARNKIKSALRRKLEDGGFVEVETPCLQVSPGNETHLHAFATAQRAVDGTTQNTLYLHTSPEFAMKKLLAAGEQRIFQFAPVFRDRGLNLGVGQNFGVVIFKFDRPSSQT